MSTLGLYKGLLDRFQVGWIKFAKTMSLNHNKYTILKPKKNSFLFFLNLNFIFYNKEVIAF